MRITSIRVRYKYVAPMHIIEKTYSEFVKSVAEKYEQFNLRKLELHVDPFYPIKSRKTELLWQIVLDFDTSAGITHAKYFLKELPSRELKYYMVEKSGQGVHVVSTFAVYPVANKFIPKLRRAIAIIHKVKIDVRSSIRRLPIRRTPSKMARAQELLVPIVPAKQFLNMSRSELDLLGSKLYFQNRTELASYLKEYTLPSKIIHFEDTDYTTELFSVARKL